MIKDEKNVRFSHFKIIEPLTKFIIRQNIRKICKIFSEPEVRYSLSLFTDENIRAVEELIIEQDGKFYIKCQIKDRYKTANCKETAIQLWIYRLLNEYHYLKQRMDVKRLVYFHLRDSGLAYIAVPHENMSHLYIIFKVIRPQRTVGLEQLKWSKILREIQLGTDIYEIKYETIKLKGLILNLYDN